jgi:ADP-dependent NAD(P)H-hydrate dehydratase / NAD(P)H-hydrate epimerase
MMREPAPAELWTAALAAASDRHTMDVLGVPSPLLMERAALCVSREVAALVRAEPRPVGVLVGPGNNGGDGLAVARQLHGWGVPVAAWLVTEGRNAAVAEQLRLALACGVAVHDGQPGDAEAGRLWVDGLLGTGSRGAPRGGVAEAVAWLHGHGGRCVAIDLPTGVDPDTGAAAELAVRAEVTVTFARSKPGLHVTPGRAHAGRVVVADIGLVPPPSGSGSASALLDPRVVAAALRGLPAGEHKGQRGHVGIVGGSPGMTGAALLAGVAALRAGAGMVTVASPDPALPAVLLAARPELMTAPLRTEPRELLPRAGALVVGPGLSDPVSQAMLPRLWAEDARPALWDASALERVPVDGVAPAGPRVITPHPGEAARLLARLAPDEGWDGGLVQARRLEAARRLAAATRAVVVLKGEGSLVAQPAPSGAAAGAGAVAVAVSGGPALATAGSGDVLAGLGGALLARGLSPWMAARVAVHVHGVAGDRLGDGSGALALDVAEALPSALLHVVRDPAHARWPLLARG